MYHPRLMLKVMSRVRCLFYKATLSSAAASALLLVAVTSPTSQASDEAATPLGERIYLKGISGSGTPLEAAHEDGGVRTTGKEAACVSCHQHSGLGSKEGQVSIPPITGRYLFYPRASGPDAADLPYVEGIRSNRAPYTDATLARAIREGLDSEGKPLQYLMPQYALNDTEMAALISYLKGLDRRRSPGVTDTVLHFATVITPDADPVKTAGMLDVLTHYFAVKNTFPIGATPPLRSSRKMMFMVNRHWDLHVWRLTGPAAGWQRQLEHHLAEEPVLAVVSGIGGANWAPVHTFCEQAAVPCLFPNVEAPPAEADRDFYSLYFSGGVLLEAGLIANSLSGREDGTSTPVVRQIYRAGDSGAHGARALAASLAARGITVQDRPIAPDAPASSIAQALRGVGSGEVIVLWLRPTDLASLGNAPDVPFTVFMSGLLGGLERTPLPSGWRERTQLAYPFDLPDHRRIGVDFARGWFSIRHISVVDEQVQADTYLACGLLAESLSHMADTFVRDYLIERVQSMIGHRIVTGYYPRLTLAAGQRFASKGGYIAQFASDTGRDIVPTSAWIRP